jgi:hypothetical protein
VNYSGIKSLFYGLIGDSADSPVWITNAMAMQYANAAIQMAAAAARHLEGRGVILLVASTQEYSLPDAADTIFRVCYDGEAILPITQSQLRVYDEEWVAKTGTPRFYYLDEMSRKIGLYEAPSSATTYSTFSGEYGVVVATDDTDDTFSQEYGIIVDASDASAAFNQEQGVLVSAVSADELEVFYKAAPAVINDDDDDPDVPQWCWPYVLFSMLGKAYASDTDMQNWALSDYWEGAASNLLARLRGRSFAKLNKTWKAKSPAWRRGGRRLGLNFPDNITEA